MTAAPNLSSVDPSMTNPVGTLSPWTRFALMLCTALAVVVLGAIPLLRALAVH
jgi:hypothetical protein